MKPARIPDHVAADPDYVTVAFSRATAGWIQMVVMTISPVKTVAIACSDVHPPFAELVAWLRAMADPRRFVEAECASKRLWRAARARQPGRRGR
jgi:hypothetical protein